MTTYRSSRSSLFASTLISCLLLAQTAWSQSSPSPETHKIQIPNTSQNPSPIPTDSPSELSEPPKVSPPPSLTLFKTTFDDPDLHQIAESFDSEILTHSRNSSDMYSEITHSKKTISDALLPFACPYTNDTCLQLLQPSIPSDEILFTTVEKNEFGVTLGLYQYSFTKKAFIHKIENIEIDLLAEGARDTLLFLSQAPFHESGTLTIHLNEPPEPGTKVFLDDSEIPLTNQSWTSNIVSVGKHTIRIILPSGKPEIRTVNIQRGQENDILFSSLLDPTLNNPDSYQVNPWLAAGWTGVGVGIALIGVGIGGSIWETSIRQVLSEMCYSLTNPWNITCSGPGAHIEGGKYGSASYLSSEVTRLQGRGRTARIMQIAGYTLGAAFVAAGAIVLTIEYLSDTKPPKDTPPDATKLSFGFGIAQDGFLATGLLQF